jgi:hypothetical protein
MDIILWLILILASMLAGFYIATQLERKIIRRTRPFPTRIDVSYIEQGSGMFYGMYIHNDSTRYCKLSKIKEANAVLRSLGIEDKLPESISQDESIKILNSIMGKFNEIHYPDCEFDWNNCMDVL